MITEFISRSAVRRGILSLLFTSPDRRYYQRQLERLLGRPVSAVRREILRLEAEGLVGREEEANVVFFRANRRHPLFREVKSIVAKTIGIPAQIREALKGVRGVRFALLFGSYTRGGWTAESDLDLMVVGTADLAVLSRALRDVEQRFQRAINPTLYAPRELVRRLDARDEFLADVFRHPVIPLIGWAESAILGPVRIAPSALKERLIGPQVGRRPRP